jgi:pyruvate formate lyase activating enzyme
MLAQMRPVGDANLGQLRDRRDRGAIDRHPAERRLEGLGGRDRQPREGGVVGRADHHDPADPTGHGPEPCVGMGGDRAGIDIAGVRGDHRLGPVCAGGLWHLGQEILDHGAQHRRVAGIEAAGHGGRPDRGHGPPLSASIVRGLRASHMSCGMPQDAMEGVEARYWHRLEDGRIQCDLCPRFCKLREGQRGLCFVRGRFADELRLTTYGRSSGFCIDPIEKKPLNHFLPGTPVLSFGTAGCNLTCKYCQNWDISKARDFDRVQDIAAPAAIAAAAARSGARSVAFTYNDPIIFLEYALDTAKACHARGIKTVAVTNGYICAAPRAEFFAGMDAVNVDLKAFTEDFYQSLCSAALAPVLETLEYVKHETDTWLEITTLLIPGSNDSPGEIEALSRWVLEHLGPDVPLHFTAFYPAWKMMDTPPTPPRSVIAAPLHRLLSGLEDDGHAADPAAERDRGAAAGARPRPAPRLHRQHPRSARPEHRLPGLRRAPDRPRRLHHHRLGTRQGRPLRQLRRALRRRLRGGPGRLGPKARTAGARQPRGGLTASCPRSWRFPSSRRRASLPEG